MTKQYTSNSSNLVEEVILQILFLDTEPFVIFTDELFQVNTYIFQKWFNPMPLNWPYLVFLLCLTPDDFTRQW